MGLIKEDRKMKDKTPENKIKDEICYCEGCDTFYVCDTKRIKPDYKGPFKPRPCSDGCLENIIRGVRIKVHYGIFGKW